MVFESEGQAIVLVILTVNKLANKIVDLTSSREAASEWLEKPIARQVVTTKVWVLNATLLISLVQKMKTDEARAEEAVHTMVLIRIRAHEFGRAGASGIIGIRNLVLCRMDILYAVTAIRKSW